LLVIFMKFAKQLKRTNQDEELKVDVGVYQGSVLGLLLFIIRNS